MVFESNELFLKARQGDAQALGELLEHYRAYLSVLTLRYLDNRLQARLDPADLVQTTFMEAHRDFGAFHGTDVGSFLGWLRNILRNNIASAHQTHLLADKRNASREVRIHATGDTSAPLGIGDVIPAETTSPSQRAMRDEAAADLAISLSRLPETQREAIRLRYLEGKSLKEIAERMNKTELAAAGLLKRGLQALRNDPLVSKKLQ